jgi:NAD(P)-dependent dehydrogenase (short-subunit alcohol dehydrogenase family)
MDLRISGQRALITGGSKGIGQAAANVLADEGCHLVLVARDKGALDEAAVAIRSRRQVDVQVISADLSTRDGVEAVARSASDIDILVNNAGAIPPGGLLDVSDETWRSAWDLKVFGFIALTRALYPSMAARRSGVIVNVIGVAGEKHPAGYIAGATGNAALIAFTRALGRSSTADGIRAVGINPGPIATARQQMLARARAEKELGDAERWREFYKTMPFGRAGKPEEIGYAVAFLASSLSGYTSGTILTIDGGG